MNIEESPSVSVLWTAFFADRGNIELRNQLVTAYRPLAQRMAEVGLRKRLGRRPKRYELDDLSSRVDLTLLRDLPRFDPDKIRKDGTKCTALHWIRFLARSAVSLREADRPIPRVEYGENEEGESLIDQAVDPKSEKADQRRELQEAISGLPEALRTIIAERFWGGCTLKEIADRTGVPLRTLDRRYAAALERLRVMLGADAAAGLMPSEDVDETLATAP